MFVDVEFEIDLGEGVLIPASAVIDSGLKRPSSSSAAGQLEPREVETGERSSDAIAIVHGVAAGGNDVATRQLPARRRVADPGAAPRRLPPPPAGDPGDPQGHRVLGPEPRARPAGGGDAVRRRGAILGTIRLDALPDLSDTQVIILSRWDRSPICSGTRSPTRS